MARQSPPPGRRRTGLAIALAALLVAVAVPAAAHEPLTIHRTYEAVTERWADCTARDDPSGLTADGFLNVNCVVLHDDELGSHDGHVQVATVDDVFGAGTVGAYVAFYDCDPHNDDADRLPAICQQVGEAGEFGGSFCGTSPVYETPPDAAWNHLVVGLNGAASQAMDCDPTSTPTATTGGVLNPGGGVFATFIE